MEAGSAESGQSSHGPGPSAGAAADAGDAAAGRARSRSCSSGSSGYSSGSGSSGRSRSPREAARPAARLGLGAVVELAGLEKAAELNGRAAVVTSIPEAGAGSGRWEAVCLAKEGPEEGEPRRVAVSAEKLRVAPEPAGSVRLRMRNVPAGYDTELMREELDDEGFSGDSCFTGLLHDASRGFCYLTAATERIAMQIMCNFDGRRLERCGPGRFMPDSRLAQIVKLERL
mmetsp:Transcript_60819/g.162806  ORF Transcript_60819/g.162806 Transcript_60819/m.162806 type:complete len:229 (-) Transcript_60819:69-755(-)